MSDCKHEFFYYLATNEEGWKCVLCNHRPGSPAGYSPELDRELLCTKVDGVLHDLHTHDFVHVSNGSGGDGIVAHVAEQMAKAGTYDQRSIAAAILACMAGDPNAAHGYAAYWKRVGEGVVSGHDIRDRCACGALATMYVSHGGKSGRFCSTECERQGWFSWDTDPPF